ncbi:Holliday junction resolvase RuvX [bacterium]|nr:MAG: Holliday junction resolvase RuvX [bacterium]
MAILAIDYGDKRIGIAIAQDGWIKPLDVIINESKEKAIEQIKALIEKNKITKVVVGLPKPLKMTTNERLVITKNFAEQLKNKIFVPVEFSSEIFTTKLAKTFSYAKKQQKYIDSRAACFILEQYLNSKKDTNKKETINKQD